MDVVYMVIDSVTGLKYVGSKKQWLGGRTYFGSPNCKSKRFKKYALQTSWKEALLQRPETFQFVVLESYDSSITHEFLLERELLWQKELDVVRSPEYVNAGFAKKGFCGNIFAQLTPEAVLLLKEKMSNSVQNRMNSLSKEERQQIYGKIGSANGNFGKHWTEEQKNAQSQKTKEYFAHNTSYKKGKTHCELYGPEKAIQISEAIGVNMSNRTGNKNHFFGKHHTEKTKIFLREKNKGKKPANTKVVLIGSLVFAGLAEASIATGEKATTIWYRIHSRNPKFDEYRYGEDETPKPEDIKLIGYESHPTIKGEVAV